MQVDVELTMNSGQPPQFLWEKNGKEYTRKWNGELITTDDVAGKLFRLKDPYKKILQEIATDSVMRKAIRRFDGLRVTKNDPWETVVVYICSSLNNMKRMKGMIQTLMVDGELPEAGKLARMDLRKARLGFREKYLRQTAGMISSYDLRKMERQPYEKVHAELMELPGVGAKVADCICLFGLGKTEAFPIDVWMGRAMKEYYGVAKEKKMKEFAEMKWGKWAGYAQQFLFELARRDL